MKPIHIVTTSTIWDSKLNRIMYTVLVNGDEIARFRTLKSALNFVSDVNWNGE